MIGNSHYQSAASIPNAANDAEDVAQAFRDMNYTTFEGLDLTKAAMAELISQWLAHSIDADVEATVFYYAGHGLQIDGSNYLVPVDLRPTTLDDVVAGGYAVDSLLESVQPIDTKIIILDACRDPPWSLQSAARTRGLTAEPASAPIRQGLAEMGAGPGTFIAFATAPNRVAYDGSGRNSPFTGALLQHIKRPHQDIGDLFTLVRRQVIYQTVGRQVPWDHSALVDRFYFTVPPPIASEGMSDGPYGALAVSDVVGGRVLFGLVSAVQNIDDAVNRAIDRCRARAGSCSLKLVANRSQCLAVALDRQSPAAGWATGASLDDAVARAIAACAAAGGSECVASDRGCNFEP